MTTSLFGGVQVFNIIFAIIRSKAAAFFIGPVGIGILGLLNSVINIISQTTKLGIDVTAVKEIAYADKNNDKVVVNKTLYLVKKLVWITGILGALITAIAAPILSQITFGDKSYTWAFLTLAFVVLIKQLTAGNLAVLRGLRKHQQLVRATIYGALFSVIVTVICYYLYGIDSIVYVIVFSALLLFFFSWIYSKKFANNKQQIKLSKKDFFDESKPMIKLGFYLSLVGVFSLVATYAFQVFLRNSADVKVVGFYQAAFVIINTYIGLVFNALRTDYFPRLSAVHNTQVELKETVLKQARVTILLITPIVIFFIVFSQLIIKILYSSEFLVISSLLIWAMLGMVFKATSFTLGYVILAKNDSKVFLKTSVIFNLLFLTMTVIGYKYFGLEGIGIAYFLYYIIHFISLKIIVNFKYKLTLDSSY